MSDFIKATWGFILTLAVACVAGIAAAPIIEAQLGFHAPALQGSAAGIAGFAALFAFLAMLSKDQATMVKFLLVLAVFAASFGFAA